MTVEVLLNQMKYLRVHHFSIYIIFPEKLLKDKVLNKKHLAEKDDLEILR